MAYGNGGTGMGQGGLDQYATSAPNTIRPMSMIAMQIERQAKASEALHKAISEIEVRLSGVTRPDMPAPATGADKQPSSLVPLAGGLSEFNDRIEGACRRLASLLDRIEL